MKSEKKKIDNKVTIINDPNEDMNDDLPEEIDFSNLEEIENPIKKKKFSFNIDPDIAKYFKSSKQLNQFLRLQIESMKKLNMLFY